MTAPPGELPLSPNAPNLPRSPVSPSSPRPPRSPQPQPLSSAQTATTTPLPPTHIHPCCAPPHIAGAAHAATAHANAIVSALPGGRLNQPVYVLSADGSQLWLVDPSKPPGNEEPPPYVPFTPIRTDTDVESGGTGAGHLGLTRVRASTYSGPHLAPLSTFPEVLPVSPGALSVNALSLQTHTPPRSRNPSTGAYPSPRSPGRRRRVAVDETTPLLGGSAGAQRVVYPTWTWGQIWGGDAEDEGSRWKRFWRPVGDKAHWKAVGHLLVVNFPFNLLIWPFLAVGTLVGTVLLITLPIGTLFWWMTLLLARWAAKCENCMQARIHLSTSPVFHPIFYRVMDVRDPTEPGGEPEVVWDRRFLKCSWAMICDHFSYSALAYFLLIKPLVVLFSTIVLLVLFPVALVLVPLLPIYLRASRAWGQYQARVAMENI